MTLFGKLALLSGLVIVVAIFATLYKSETVMAPEDSKVVPPGDTTPNVPVPSTPPTGDTAVIEEEVPNLIVRNLSGQGLTEAPRSIFNERDVEVLDLSGNKLVSLQAEIRQLSNLRILDLSNNQMTNIPAELGQLSKLEVLDLSGNKLTGLPYELGNLKNLKTLDLRGNNYAEADLEIIKQGIPQATILTDTE